MSTRALLPSLPGGIEVYRTKSALELQNKGMLAPLKKGIAGWTKMESTVIACVAFQQNNQRVWKAIRIGMINFVKGPRLEADLHHDTERRVT